MCDFTEDAVLLSAPKERLLVMEEQIQHGKGEIVSLPSEVSGESAVQEPFEKRVRTEAYSATRRANQVEKDIGEVRSEVDTLRNALRGVRELSERAMKQTESTEAQLEVEVSALRTGRVVPVSIPAHKHKLRRLTLECCEFEQGLHDPIDSAGDLQRRVLPGLLVPLSDPRVKRRCDLLPVTIPRVRRKRADDRRNGVITIET
jgi:hypothetical protein